jgi:hypothetical protein
MSVPPHPKSDHYKDVTPAIELFMVQSLAEFGKIYEPKFSAMESRLSEIETQLRILAANKRQRLTGWQLFGIITGAIAAGAGIIKAFM